MVDPPVPPSTDQLIAAGWGYASLAPASIQADNGAGLNQGIIGLANRGRRRRPEDWGALRAWGWGAGRGLDFLATLPAVAASRVGIEGVSRYGKAALVTMAFDPRFHFALIGSSGEGGAKPYRRDFGEAVENLTSSGEYHWMAGNFLKYGAERSAFGRRDASDLPVDSPELIALCAPRPTFLSYGVPEKGDSRWLDQQGSFMAAVAAGPMYRLLGARDLGVPGDYRTAPMPPPGTALLDGELAWRQHGGGHEDRSNMGYFIGWADGLMGGKPPDGTPAAPSATVPAPRTDANSRRAHEQLLAKAHQGRIDVYFLGDSITRRWGATDYPDFLANWNRNFRGWNAADFGWGGDQVQNILWRVEHGELDGVNPKVIVLLAGTNNVGKEPADEAKVADITQGIGALLALCRRKAPGATIILTAIFPRNDTPAAGPAIDRINAGLATLADGRRVRFLNVNDRLADAHGRLHAGMTVDLLHPTAQGYQVWADGLRPILTELLGPPAAVDAAPPPTGDPSAAPGRP
jgi:lysophospholipase L1-like esterase